jgi:hypothetical protein
MMPEVNDTPTDRRLSHDGPQRFIAVNGIFRRIVARRQGVRSL